MIYRDLRLDADFSDVAETHFNTLTAILDAVQRGLITPAEAGQLIDRIRNHPPAKEKK
ncbi:hypothetical protein [Amycolatopsis sp. YIM 10]|uniref:hypothetical protein n=1 Tax=Amycolatopsis sp. YIM 10 TaxID=2653857 RepID=UPI0012904B97|nr:hypothetical protein [Amycolatopsis sp. YIM 10]QFU86809.1 hypothetical protein YIM_07990 [Amycolatopsis sp. YIM 10]